LDLRLSTNSWLSYIFLSLLETMKVLRSSFNTTLKLTKPCSSAETLSLPIKSLEELNFSQTCSITLKQAISTTKITKKPMLESFNLMSRDSVKFSMKTCTRNGSEMLKQSDLNLRRTDEKNILQAKPY
jgi:hypothetical protein